ncbi:MAG TPA: glycosyltransferase family 4 protein [bacterium]|nr:glycosyltransferase family 4 protein [bacterium]
MKKRLLFWNEFYLPTIGGIEVLCGQLVDALKKRGYDIAVVSDDRRGRHRPEELVAGTRVFRLPFLRGMAGELPAIAEVKKRLAAILEEWRPELIHLHSSGPSLFYFLENRVFEKFASLWTVHSTEYPKAEWNLRILRAVTAANAVSAYIQRHIQSWDPSVEWKVPVIYNGLRMPESTEAVAPTSSFILMAGRVEKEKGFDVALRAFAAIRDSFPAFRLKLAGDGKALFELRALAEELGLSPAVDFLGWVAPAEMPALTAQSTLVTVPSRWEEPFGLVALQAMQLGKPVIATRVGGLPEVVLHRETGLLVPKDEAGELAQAMMEILREPALGSAMGQRGRERAERVFDFERMVDEYEALYRSLPAIIP